jgi:LAO/AO transport system kinase
LIQKKQEPAPSELVERMIKGETLSLGRVIAHLESGDLAATEMVGVIHRHTGRAHRIGLTGVPGGGKSTTIDKLTAVFRKHGASVGIIAVDPTSPFSGGAVLGDRVRMQQHYLDKGVFIRSMATRGNSGGLPKTIGEVADALDASGKDVILIETVGVGQSELDIVKNVDTVVVVLAPGLGDGIQAMKAGVLEIADVFAINKDDLPGALELTLEISNLVAPMRGKKYWDVPVVTMQASSNKNIDELHRQICAHYETLRSSSLLEERRQRQRRDHFTQMVKERLASGIDGILRQDASLAGFIDDVATGKLDTYSAVEKVFESEALFASLKAKLRDGESPAK